MMLIVGLGTVVGEVVGGEASEGVVIEHISGRAIAATPRSENFENNRKLLHMRQLAILRPRKKSHGVSDRQNRQTAIQTYWPSSEKVNILFEYFDFLDSGFRSIPQFW